MNAFLSFLLVIGLAIGISAYAVSIIVMCIMFGVFNKKQDYDYTVLKAIWAFVVVTVVFYGLGKVGYWLLMI